MSWDLMGAISTLEFTSNLKLCQSTTIETRKYRDTVWIEAIFRLAIGLGEPIFGYLVK